MLALCVCSTQSVDFHNSTNTMNGSQREIIISVFLSSCSAQSNEALCAFSFAPPLRSEPVMSSQNETVWPS